MKLTRVGAAWSLAALVTAIGWGALGYVVEGLPGLLVAAGISVGAITGIASLAQD